MQKIKGDGATGDNRFTEGNPQTGVPATQVTDDWLNSVQGELVNAVTGSGLELDDTRNDQLLTVINKLLGKSEKASTTVARNGVNDDKWMTAAGTHAAFNQYGLGVRSGKMIATNADVNTLLTSGMYYVSGNASNTPISSDGYLTVSAAAQEQRVSQVYTVCTNDETYTRVMNNNIWSTWTRTVKAGTSVKLPETKTFSLSDADSTAYSAYELNRKDDQGRNVTAYSAISNIGSYNLGVKHGNIESSLVLKADGDLRVNGNIVYHSGNLGLSSQTTPGIISRANQVEVNAGSDDTKAVTPAKMTNGSSVDIVGGDPVRIVFPSWLGGIIIQWGRVTTSNIRNTIVWPTVFPQKCLFATTGAVIEGFDRYYFTQMISYTNNSFEYVIYSNTAGSAPVSSTGGVTITFSFLAIGR